MVDETPKLSHAASQYNYNRRYDKAPYLHNELRERVSSLRGQSRAEKAHKKEVDEIIHWLTGYTQKQLAATLKKETDFETFLRRLQS